MFAPHFICPATFCLINSQDVLSKAEMMKIGVSWRPRVLIQAGQESNNVQQRCTGCIASCLHLLASKVCAAGMCRPFSSQNWVQLESRKCFCLHFLCPLNTCRVFSQIAGDINLRHLETCLWENASNERTSWLCILIHQFNHATQRCRILNYPGRSSAQLHCECRFVRALDV